MVDQYVIWAVVCLAVAVFLFLLEIFIPSGGLIGLAASGALVAGIVLLFLVDTTLGLLGALVVLACVPLVLAMVIKVWPNTPLARLLTLEARQKRRVGGASAVQESAGARPEEQSVLQPGARGKALTDLRPVGVCLIEGRRVDCLAERGVIPAGTAVRVVVVDGMQVKVRAEE